MKRSSKVVNFIDETAKVGCGSVVWHFAVVLAEVVIGRRCSIGSHAEIGRGSVIGDDSRIGSGVFLPSRSIVGENVFIGPRACFTDDRHPYVNHVGYFAEPPVLESGCSIGAGAVILPGVTVGTGAIIGAGAIVTHDVPAHSHVRGEPARAKPYSRIKTELSYEIYSADVQERLLQQEMTDVIGD